MAVGSKFMKKPILIQCNLIKGLDALKLDMESVNP